MSELATMYINMTVGPVITINFGNAETVSVFVQHHLSQPAQPIVHVHVKLSLCTVVVHCVRQPHPYYSHFVQAPNGKTSFIIAGVYSLYSNITQDLI